MDELDDFFSDISKVETASDSNGVSTEPVVGQSEEVQQPPEKRNKMETTYFAKPQVISAKPQPAVVRSAPPMSSSASTSSASVASSLPYAKETLATDPSSMIPASAASHYPASSHSSAGITSSSYQAYHMGMTPDEAKLVESQQRGYDYDKQKKLASSGGGGGQSQKKHIRTNANGDTWEDPTLQEWPDDDHRLFVGDLGNECTDDLLVRAFSKYPSFLKAKVVRDKFTCKSKGFGFLSFSDPFDMVKCLREMNGKYIGNRPIRLTKSSWKDQEVGEVRKRHKKEKKRKAQLGLA